MKTSLVLIAFTAACTSAPEDSWKPTDRPVGYDACEVDHVDPMYPYKDLTEWRTFSDGALSRSVFGGVSDQGEVVATEEHDFTYRGDRVATETIDNHGDRTVNRWFYDDANGNLLRAEWGVDSASARIDLYTYDERGLLQRVDHDEQSDGTIDEYEIVTNDANGCTSSIDFYGVSPAVHEHDVFTMNSACKPTRIDYDDNADGLVDSNEDWTYVHGDVLPSTYRRGTTQQGWTYDEQWRLVKHQTSVPTSPLPTTDTYLYDCKPPRP